MITNNHPYYTITGVELVSPRGSVSMTRARILSLIAHVAKIPNSMTSTLREQCAGIPTPQLRDLLRTLDTMRRADRRNDAKYQKHATNFSDLPLNSWENGGKAGNGTRDSLPGSELHNSGE